MGYHSSSIVLQKDGLFKTTITYKGWIWNWSETETFKTLNEANEWLLSKRCFNHRVETLMEEKKLEKKKTTDAIADEQIRRLEEAVESANKEEEAKGYIAPRVRYQSPKPKAIRTKSGKLRW